MMLGFFRKLKQRFTVKKHMKALRGKSAEDSREYAEYLQTQLQRTLEKKGATLPDRAKDFIDSISCHVTLAQCRILCVGCRNTAEIEYFRACGAAAVSGIDLYSESPDIQVMDMHAMAFADNTFDLLYSSHSLEHANDVKRATSEFSRVVKSGGHIAIEVPVNYETGGADLVDFKSLDDLHAFFSPRLEKVLWSKMQERGTKVGTGCVATLFKIRK